MPQSMSSAPVADRLTSMRRPAASVISLSSKRLARSFSVKVTSDSPTRHKNKTDLKSVPQFDATFSVGWILCLPKALVEVARDLLQVIEATRHRPGSA